jgi:dTDP-4-dehydrorhamnose 3,5-epimerase-like enzyme
MCKYLEFRNFTITELGIGGLLHIQLKQFNDNRGYVSEAWRQSLFDAMHENGMTKTRFVGLQENDVKNVLLAGRGFHAEKGTDKYIRCVSGEVDVKYLDLSEESPTFRKRIDLHILPGEAIYVPEGVGNSFASLNLDAMYSYVFNKEWERRDTNIMVNFFTDEGGWTPDQVKYVSEEDLNYEVLSKLFPTGREK